MSGSFQFVNRKPHYQQAVGPHRLTKQAMYVLRKIEVRSQNHCCRGKAINTAYSECAFVTKIIQYTKRIRCIILSSIACSDLPFFPTLSHKGYDFLGENVAEHKMCFDFLYNFCLKPLSFREKLSQILSKMYIGIL
jgi:hypothetical protein